MFLGFFCIKRLKSAEKKLKGKIIIRESGRRKVAYRPGKETGEGLQSPEIFGRVRFHFVSRNYKSIKVKLNTQKRPIKFKYWEYESSSRGFKPIIFTPYARDLQNNVGKVVHRVWATPAN